MNRNKIEYRLLYLGNPDDGEDYQMGRLNRFGADGWEVLGTIGTYTLVLGRVVIPEPAKSAWNPSGWFSKGWG